LLCASIILFMIYFRCVCFPLAKGPGYSAFTCSFFLVYVELFAGFMELRAGFSSSVSGHQSSSAVINHQSAFMSHHHPSSVFFQYCFVRASYYSWSISDVFAFHLPKALNLYVVSERGPPFAAIVFLLVFFLVYVELFAGFIELCVVCSSSVSGHQSSSAVINHQSAFISHHHPSSVVFTSNGPEYKQWTRIQWIIIHHQSSSSNNGPEYKHHRLQSNPNGLEHSPKVNEPENTAPTRQRTQPQPEDTAPMSQNAAPTGQNSVLMGHIGFHFGTALQTNPAYARGQGTCGQAVRRQASSH